MAFLIACLLIYGFGLAPWWYGVSAIVWIISLGVRFWVLAAASRK